MHFYVRTLTFFPPTRGGELLPLYPVFYVRWKNGCHSLISFAKTNIWVVMTLLSEWYPPPACETNRDSSGSESKGATGSCTHKKEHRQQNATVNPFRNNHRLWRISATKWVFLHHVLLRWILLDMQQKAKCKLKCCLNVSMLSMAKMLTVHLTRHHCICTAQKLHLWVSRARSQSPHRHAHCEFRTVTNIFYNLTRQWDARKGPRP